MKQDDIDAAQALFDAIPERPVASPEVRELFNQRRTPEGTPDEVIELIRYLEAEWNYELKVKEYIIATSQGVMDIAQEAIDLIPDEAEQARLQENKDKAKAAMSAGRTAKSEEQWNYAESAKHILRLVQDALKAGKSPRKFLNDEYKRLRRNHPSKKIPTRQNWDKGMAKRFAQLDSTITADKISARYQP